MISGWATIHRVLITLGRRIEDNQVLEFTPFQNSLQRGLAIVASVISIISCLAAIYSFLAIDPKRLVFRHQLIAFLIMFDLLKGVVLLIFPTRVVAVPSSYYNEVFCQVIGFFTATSIQGADLAILSFAIHTFLLIFRPSLTMKLSNSDRVEGGLFRFRYYVYGLSFLIPLALASFAYIGRGYESFVCWCYLPQRPVWYRLALSWVPRYVIVVIIILVYCLIYFHVLKEFRTLGGFFSTMHRPRDKNALHPTLLMAKPSFFSAIRYFFESLRDHIFPKLVLPGENSDVSSTDTTSDSNIDPIAMQPYGSPGGISLLQDENAVGTDTFQAANLEHFRHRQKLIEKQMKSIFIYPVAYILMWLFPFILQCTQFNHEYHHGPIVWLNCVGAFMQPFYGFVDSMVFFYREQPWKHTIMKNFAKLYVPHLEAFPIKKTSVGDTDSTLSIKHFSGKTNVDISQYSRWRQILCKLRFPLMQLPTERNVAKLEASFAANRKQTIHSQAHLGALDEKAPDYNDLHAKHDFSNLLLESMSDTEFRHSFNKYSMSFPSENARHSTTTHSGGRRPSVASTSNRSTKSRRYSCINDAFPIPESSEFVLSPSKARTGTSISGRKSLQRTSLGCDSNVDSVDTDTNNMEIDLFEFLQRGPQ